MDARLDQVLDKDLFEQRKAALLMERTDLERGLVELQDGGATQPDRLQEFLELAGSAYLIYQAANLRKRPVRAVLD